MVEERGALERRVKLSRLLAERKASGLQKALIKYLEPENLLELEEELKELLQVERSLVKAASRMNVSPNRLVTVIEDLIDIINLLQI